MRAEVLAALAEKVLAVRRDHPTRVVIDGFSAAGKSTFGDELAAELRERSPRHVIRVTLDQFKQAVGQRIRYPHGTPENYYFEMFDAPSIRDLLLLPLGPGGDRRFRSAIMNFNGRTAISAPTETAPGDAILVADSGFPHKPELRPHWDLTVWLDIDVADVQRRGPQRDLAWMDSLEAAEQRYREYYIPGEQLYVAEVGPAGQADIVVDNRDFAEARILIDRTGAR